MATPSFSKKVTGTLGTVVDFLNPLSTKRAPAPTEDRKCVVRKQEHNGLTWIDVENPKRKELTELGEQYDFHSLHLQACMKKGQLDRIETEDSYIFIVLHSPKYQHAAAKIVTEKNCIFLGKKFIITVHPHAHSAILDLFHEVETDEKKRDEILKKSAAYMSYQVLMTLVTDLSTALDLTLREVADIEDTVFDVNTSGAYTISELRQKIVKQSRIINAFKNIAQGLVADTSDLTKSMARYYKQIANEVLKLRETLDEAKETVEIYKDADFTVSTERTNKILGILTVIFTLAIPAQIVGSFYGMNIYLPGGLEAGPWLSLGPFTTFYFVIAMALVPAGLMLIWFKIKRWF